MTKEDQRKFESMKKAGEASSIGLKNVLDAIKVGIRLRELDRLAEDTIISQGAEPGFKRVPDYDYTTCINVNEGIVHGIPTDYALKMGDVVSVDLGAFYKGYNSDQCWTVEVGTNKEDHFLDIGKKALEKAIKQARPGNRVGDISRAIQEEIESAGFSVSRDLVGHGVGKKLHESPYVPGYVSFNRGKKLKEGMSLAIEVIYQKGNYPIVIGDDDWTVETVDKSLSAVFEHSVGITSGDPLVFTLF